MYLHRPTTQFQFLLGVFTSALAAAASAQDVAQWSDASGALALSEVVISASRTEREVDLTPKPVSVITREQIANRPLANIQQLLDDTPGISYSRAGGLGGQVVVRGLNSNDPRMVLFVDGDRFRGRNTLEYNLLDPSEIERIEIVRGPASALYGADAMAGVVNVITRRAQGDPFGPLRLTPRVAALGYASANDLVGGRLELQGLGGGVDALVGVNYRHASDYDTPQGTVRNSDFEARAGTARIGFSPDANQRFEFIGRINRTESGRAGGIGGAPGAPRLVVREDPLDEDYVRLAYTRTAVTSWIDGLDVSLYRRELDTMIRTEDRTAANGSVSFRNSYVGGPEVYGGKAIARTALGETLLTYGTDFYYEDRPGSENDAVTRNAAGAVTASTVRAKRNRDATQLNAGAFVNGDWDPSPRWTVSLAGRYDTIRTEVEGVTAIGETPALTAAFNRNRSVTDQAVTGSGGLIFRPLQALHLVGSIATAFRAPATFEKYSGSVAGAVTTVPNPDLEPEKSINYEAGFRVRLPAFTLNVTGFRSDYDDLLQTVNVNATTRQRQNTGEARLTGVEVDGAYTLSRAITARFNVSQVRGTNTQTGTPIAYVPPLNGLLALRYSPELYYVEGSVRASSAKTRIDPSQERRSGGYATYNLYVGTELARFAPSLKGYRVSLGVENVFDRAYVNPVSQANLAFPVSIANPLLEPGRSLVVNLVYAL